MKQNREIVVGSVVAVLLVGIIIWLVLANFASRDHSTTVPVSSTASSTASLASTTPQKRSTTPSITYHAPVTKKSPVLFTVDSRDTIASWKLQINESTTTKEKLQAQIKTLTGDIGKGHYSDFNIYAQIAQYYALLGSGKDAYNFYLRAAEKDPTKGLPFSNIGNLMAQLGAYHTAQNAYAKSVALQPHTEIFWLSYLRFLSAHEATAPATPAVFATAKKAMSSAPNVLIAEANWRAQVGNISGAIADWKLVLPKVGAAQQKAIDSKITSLQKQQ